VAVRVPTKGVPVVAVLEKRPFDPEWETPEGSRPLSPEISEPQPTRPPKRISTRPKLMTPEHIKAAKIITGAALFTATIVTLIDINISLMQNSSSSR
jgi:hypothetical protein